MVMLAPVSPTPDRVMALARAIDALAEAATVKRDECESVRQLRED